MSALTAAFVFRACSNVRFKSSRPMPRPCCPGLTSAALVAENGLENTQVVLTGVTRAGEFKAARDQRSGAGAQVRRGWGSFGAPYYNGPQAYSGPQWSYSRW